MSDLYGIIADIVGGQEPLGAEFERVLLENLWGLYQND